MISFRQLEAALGVARAAMLTLVMGVALAPDTSAQEAVPITPDVLDGIWEGKQKWAGGSGPIIVTFQGDSASYWVKDGSEEYTWVATVQIMDDGAKVVTAPTTFKREDTFSLKRDGDALILKGSYTFKGKPWGSITLTKQD
jgi:hypothetical protein